MGILIRYLIDRGGVEICYASSSWITDLIHGSKSSFTYYLSQVDKEVISDKDVFGVTLKAIEYCGDYLIVKPKRCIIINAEQIGLDGYYFVMLEKNFIGSREYSRNFFTQEEVTQFLKEEYTGEEE